MASGYGEEQFRIPKLAIPVELLMEGGHTLRGHLHLLAEAATHTGRERLADLLEGRDAFLPLTGVDGARLVAVNRIVLARFSDPADAGWEEVDTADPEVRITLSLVGVAPDRQHLAGTILIAMPPGRTRLLDYLNAVGPFFPMRDDDGVMLVARRYVLEVRQV